jgi:hypothetical protein
MVLKELLTSHVDLASVTDICLWADTGTHFRTWGLMSFVACTLCETLKRTFHIKFGLERHCKGRLDGYFSTLGQAKKNYAAKQLIDCIEAMVAVWVASATEASKHEPNRAAEVFIEYMPPHRSTVPNERIDSKTVTASIKGCHYWIFAPIPGRVHMRGKGIHSRWLTGLKVKSMMLSGIGAHAVAAAVQPRLLPSDVVLFPPDDEDEEPAVLPSEVLQLSKEHLGWRISYRTEIPESPDLTKFPKRLRNKINDLEIVSKAFVDGNRHASSEDKRLRAEARQNNKNEKQNAISLFFRSKIAQ